MKNKLLAAILIASLGAPALAYGQQGDCISVGGSVQCGEIDENKLRDALIGITVIAVITTSVVKAKNKKNSEDEFNFFAIPTSENSYIARFTHSPRENLNINAEFSKGNLFAEHDTVKPETNSTVMATVKWTW